MVMMGLSKGELEDFMITHRLDMKTEGRRVTLMKRSMKGVLNILRLRGSYIFNMS